MKTITLKTNVTIHDALQRGFFHNARQETTSLHLPKGTEVCIIKDYIDGFTHVRWDDTELLVPNRLLPSELK